MGVAGGGFDFKNAFFDSKKRNIESATAEVEDEDVFFADIGGFFVEAVGDGGGGGLVDDAHDVEAGDDAGVFGGLALGVVEVSRDGDDGVFDGGAEEGFGDLAHFDEDHGGDFFGGEVFVFAFVVDDDGGFVAGAGDYLEWPVLYVVLHRGFAESPSDQTLRILYIKTQC